MDAKNRELHVLNAILVGLIALLIGMLWLGHKHDERLMTTWTVVAEGVYDHADYGTFDRTWQSSHGAVHHVTVDTTLVFFDDGRTCAMEGRVDMPFPKGTRIRVLENGFNAYRVDKAPDP